MHVNIRSLLTKFVIFTALADSANPDVLGGSESWFRKITKTHEISIPNYNIFRQDRASKGAELQYTAGIACRVLSLLSRSVPKQFELVLLKIHLSRNKSLNIAACYGPPSAPSCVLDTIRKLIAPHLSLELVLLGDLNWDNLNTPAILQSNESTRYHPKSVNTGTLRYHPKNLPSKYTSAVFKQDLSDHCPIACTRNGASASRPL
jgi:hypothetical protein